MSESVSGNASGMPSGGRLWLVVTPPTPPRYYPQGPGAVAVAPDGHFDGTAYFGTNSPTSIGDYQLRLVLVDPAGDSTFSGYIATGNATGNYPGLAALPPGAKILARVQVTRKQ
jgi:hypothetical protein